MAALIGHSPSAVVGAPGSIHTALQNTILTRAFDINGNEYIYLKGVASTIAGSWVTFDELGATALMDTDTAASVLGQVAIASGAIVADRWGWYLIAGSASAGALTVVDNTKVFASATAGSCDDTGTAGLQVMNAQWRSADASSLATVQIFYPFVGVNVA